MVTVFFSYAHEDARYRDELEKHLSALKRERLIEAWHDRRIGAGVGLHDEIARNLEAAQVILLLISPDFLASDYCYEREMTRALERHEKGEAVIIPVIVRPCDWEHSPFAGLRASPPDGKPITKFANLDDAYLAVTRDIREAVGRFGVAQPPHRPSVGGATTSQNPEPTLSRPRSSNLRVKREFSDHEKDTFLEDTFEFMANFFEESLAELVRRNPSITTNFRRLSRERFVVAVYRGGSKRASCQVYIRRGFGTPGIAFLESDAERGDAFNQLLSVSDDGYNLALKGIMPSMDGQAPEGLSQEGAAEHYWSVLVEHLQ